MVTRYTGGLSQLPVVEMSWGKNLRKNLWFRTTFVCYSILKSQVCKFVGGISRLPVVEMSWGKKSKKKPGVLDNFSFLLNFEITNIDWPYDSHSQLCRVIYKNILSSHPSHITENIIFSMGFRLLRINVIVKTYLKLDLLNSEMKLSFQETISQNWLTLNFKDCTIYQEKTMKRKGGLP